MLEWRHMTDPLVQALIALCKDESTGGRAGVAKATRVNPQTIYQIVSGVLLKSGKPRGVGRELAGKLDAAFPGWRQLGLPASEADTAHPLKAGARIPVVGEVKGGEGGYFDELQYPPGSGDGFVEYPSTDANAYALRVRGDSMHPRFRAGEFVIVEPGIQPQEGDDVIVCRTNGQKLLKQLNWIRDGEVQLLSINNGYGPLTLSLADVESIQLVGGRVRRNALRHD